MSTGDQTGVGKKPELVDASKKMGPLAVILNPLSPTKDKILLYSSSTQRTLTLEHRALDGKSTGSSIQPDANDSFEQLLAYPSLLAAMVLEETICVYGIIGNEGHYKVAIVSPAWQSVPQLSPATTSIAGFSAKGGTEGYLYFQGTESGQPAIREFPFRLSNLTKASSVPLGSLPNFLPGTKLAAASDSKGNRWLVYQSKDTTICVYNAKTRENVRIDKTTKLLSSDAQARPALGVCVAPADKASGRPARVYVYFVAADKHAHVVVGQISEADSLLSFGVNVTPAATFNVQVGPNAIIEVPEWSQLAALPYAARVQSLDPDAEEQKMGPKPCNLLFSFASDGDTVRQIECDEWK